MRFNILIEWVKAGRLMGIESAKSMPLLRNYICNLRVECRPVYGCLCSPF